MSSIRLSRSIHLPFYRTLLLLFLWVLILLKDVLTPVVGSTVSTVVRLVVRNLVALHQLGAGVWRRISHSVSLRFSWRLYWLPDCCGLLY